MTSASGTVGMVYKAIVPVNQHSEELARRFTVYVPSHPRYGKRVDRTGRNVPGRCACHDSRSAVSVDD